VARGSRVLVDSARALECLKSFDFAALFIEELGWDRSSARPVSVHVDGDEYQLRSVAEKRGVQFLECRSDTDSPVPPYRTRQLIERQVRRYAYEHLIVFTDSGATTQVWQWVAKDPGKPLAYREHTYVAGQPGLSLLQKLEYIAFPLSAEEALTISGVTVRLRDAFDRDRVTKRFYDRFRAEHAAFLKSIDGIGSGPDREWYASVMLNRLMFVYFIQKKGFLASDPDYLGNHLQAVQSQRVQDHSPSFYRHFLLRLFHDGLGSRETDAALTSLLGRVPYLDGGLFDIHRLELCYPDIDIPDPAFERLFAFFDSYTWHLDERPLKADNEISPDVLGYIFEKYVNQRELGAYYTKEDITGYIARNTIVPYVIARAIEGCAVAFRSGGAWRLLAEDPDRYIPEAVRRGTGCLMPAVVTAGLHDVRERGGWNTLADPEVGLRGETWRNYLARRQWYEIVKRKLSDGSVVCPSDLVTYNVDSLQFLQDIIESCEGPDLLRAIYDAVSKVSVLDPACGSGAFLFAALNVLERLREACLDRMQAFVDDAERLAVLHHESAHEALADFREILEQTAEHPSRSYFVLKSTVVNNLYGVDLLDEAAEICKLRIFLKLIAQVDNFEDIEPLPDIDLNIRTGNSLIGFATPSELESTMSRRLDFEGASRTIDDGAREIDGLFAAFRAMQTGSFARSGDSKRAKDRLVAKLEALSGQLTMYLAQQCGIRPDDGEAYSDWLERNKPFHWWLQFYGIMQSGGFSVVIGNPPYLESREVAYVPEGFESVDSGAIHAMFVERSVQLLEACGTVSMIVPLALVSTQRMKVVQGILERRGSVWYANFSWRPGKLFDVVNRALTIFTVLSDKRDVAHSTGYRKWFSDTRSDLTRIFHEHPGSGADLATKDPPEQG